MKIQYLPTQFKFIDHIPSGSAGASDSDSSSDEIASRSGSTVGAYFVLTNIFH